MHASEARITYYLPGFVLLLHLSCERHRLHLFIESPNMFLRGMCIIELPTIHIRQLKRVSVTSIDENAHFTSFKIFQQSRIVTNFKNEFFKFVNIRNVMNSVLIVLAS